MKRGVSLISLQDSMEQKRTINEVNFKSHLLPMQLQTKPTSNQKFGISPKLPTQTSDNPLVSLRTNITKNPQQTERSLIYDFDASLLYVHKEKVDILDDLQEEKASQLMKEIQQKMPQVIDKLLHFYSLSQNVDVNIKLLINQFNKVIEGILQIYDNKVQEYQNLEYKNRSLKEQLISNSKVVEEQLQYFKNKEKEIFSSKQIGRQYQRSNELTMRNVQLEKKIEYLNQTISNLMQQNKESVTTKLQIKVDTLSKELEDESERYRKINDHALQLQQQLSSNKSTDLKYQIQLKNLESKIEKLDQDLREALIKIQCQSDSLEQYHEINQMQLEDYRSLKFNYSDEKKSIQRTQDKIKLLQNRIDEMTVKRSKQIDGPLDNKIDADKLQFQQITKILDEDHVFQRYMMSSFQKNVQDYDSKLVDAYIESKRLLIGKDDEAELQTLRYNFPPFQLYIEQKIIDLESPYLPQRPLDNIFMGQLRSIMDGMYIEMQKENPLSFQAFAISWLSTFTIQNHQVIQLPEDTKRIKIEQNINTFYLDLQVPRMNKVWEVLQFRHFLNDIYSEEELYFYLHARNQLRRGPWMETFDGLYSVVHYMKLSQAKSIVSRYLENFDKINQNVVLKALQDRMIEGKRDRQLLQTGYVLQLLLEIFRIDRNNRYKVLSFAFPAQPVTFKQFHKFLKGNYAECSEGQVADLWREVYMISNGMPNLNSFFIAAQKLFIKCLKLPQLFHQPILDENQKLQLTEQNQTTIFLSEQLKELKDSQLQLLKQELLSTYQENVLDNKFYTKKSLLQDSPMAFIQNLMKSLALLRLKKNISSQIDEEGYNTEEIEIGGFVKFILNQIHQLEREKELKDVWWNDQEIRISRFQRYAQKKIKKIYVIMSSVLQARLNQ